MLLYIDTDDMVVFNRSEYWSSSELDGYYQIPPALAAKFTTADRQRLAEARRTNQQPADSPH
jgi:hypothetical protein